jgi:hypothetical protein
MRCLKTNAMKDPRSTGMQGASGALALALLAGIVILPLTTDATPGRQGIEIARRERSNFKSEAAKERGDLRSVRRGYARAVDKCKAGRETGDTDPFCKTFWVAVDACLTSRGIGMNTSCPDINDPNLRAAYRKLRSGTRHERQDKKAEAEPQVHAAVDAKPLSARDLSREDEQILRHYVRAKTCPSTLQDYLPGFFELCLSIVGEGANREPIVGMLSDKASIRIGRASK